MFKPIILASSLALGLAGCSAAGDTPVADDTAALHAPSPATKLAACPTYVPSAPVGGAPPGAAGPPLATTVAPSDTSSSIVLDVTGDPQMQCATSGRTLTSNIVYSTPTLADGSKLPLQLDILRPAGKALLPLVIAVPGGGFVTAIKEQAIDLRSYVADAGFVVASLQYRTIPNGAIYSDGIIDVKAAIRFLRAHAHAYGIDPAHIAVWGQSAGAYIAAMVGTTNGLPQFEAGDDLDQSSAVQAVVDEFGTSDMTRIASDFDAATQAYYQTPDNFVAVYTLGANSGKILADDPAVAKAADPITYVDATDPPFLLEHGSLDVIISPSQTLLLHTALRAAGVDSTRYVLKGASHGDLSFLGNFTAGIPWTTKRAADTIVDFLRDKLVYCSFGLQPPPRSTR